jgi:hypothetical protein
MRGVQAFPAGQGADLPRLGGGVGFLEDGELVLRCEPSALETLRHLGIWRHRTILPFPGMRHSAVDMDPVSFPALGWLVSSGKSSHVMLAETGAPARCRHSQLRRLEHRSTQTVTVVNDDVRLREPTSLDWFASPGSGPTGDGCSENVVIYEIEHVGKSI